MDNNNVTCTGELPNENIYETQYPVIIGIAHYVVFISKRCYKL